MSIINPTSFQTNVELKPCANRLTSNVHVNGCQRIRLLKDVNRIEGPVERSFHHASSQWTILQPLPACFSTNVMFRIKWQRVILPNKPNYSLRANLYFIGGEFFTFSRPPSPSCPRPLVAFPLEIELSPHPKSQSTYTSTKVRTGGWVP